MKKIKEMTQEELEKYIYDINEEQIWNICHLAICEIFEKGIVIENAYKENFGKIEKLNERKELERIYEEIENIILNIAQKGSNVNMDIDNLKELRKNIVNLIMILSSYITEISYVNEISNDIIKKDSFKKIIVDEEINLEDFYNDVYKFLIEDMNKLPDKISDIVKVIPLRITKTKYYEIIRNDLKKSLKGLSEKQINLIIERYKSIFNGAMVVEYGQKFDIYFRKAQEFKRFDFKKAKIQEIKNLEEESLQVLMELYSIITLIRGMGQLINRFIVLAYALENNQNIKLDEIEELSEKAIEYKRESKPNIKEEIISLCNNKINKAESRINNNNKLLEEIYKEYSKKKLKLKENLNLKLLETKKLLIYINDYNLEKEELLFLEKSYKTKNDYVQHIIDSFIQFIDRNIKGMSNIKRKARMRRLLSVLEFPFERPEEFFYYLKNSIELHTTKKDIMFIMDKVAHVMEKYE
ncbi:hypothetical protein [Thermohalobacter berrensis]|uniref:Uncharacterized protein n=1 Tax=Thermohalobacter berrensis TaxID=99594 RepID=A0A419T598_9FIRM|nr:hypothetical protein [Thermohalobacter berrensis]RKD32714.1 hypothetical protein BET03_10280 [Thermohalobacter berrensis]